jgi:hypothetical protein
MLYVKTTSTALNKESRGLSFSFISLKNLKVSAFYFLMLKSNKKPPTKLQSPLGSLTYYFSFLSRKTHK